MAECATWETRETEPLEWLGLLWPGRGKDVRWALILALRCLSFSSHCAMCHCRCLEAKLSPIWGPQPTTRSLRPSFKYPCLLAQPSPIPAASLEPQPLRNWPCRGSPRPGRSHRRPRGASPRAQRSLGCRLGPRPSPLGWQREVQAAAHGGRARALVDAGARRVWR